ncbi:MAG: hypothetical protein H6797_05915 [Candidatus Nomurabacteria bacterium]|nr:MAG: hypothetical protein H6797_05915 [Candidatus Nomurabacteria bacterium]
MLGLSIRKHTKKIVVGAIIVLGLFSAFPTISPQSAYAAPPVAPTSPTTGTANGGTGSGTSTSQNSGTSAPTTCAIEKIGWILCPVIEWGGKIGDGAFNMLAKFFLQTEPELLSSDSTNGTKIAWELARNLANIMFIIAFLTIILSQVTGRGIDNYGIKRMLPRLIIAAVAVNVSYYICQLMVDLSNIAGWEIESFLVQTAHQVSSYVAMPIQTSIDNQTSSGNLGTLATIAIAVMALGVVVYLLPALFSIIMVIAVTCMTIVVILLLRKAIIVLLVVVSPIAFVMYLLPNTEKLYNKWLKMFGQLLMVFPIVSLLFGGGQLASAIILVAGSHGNTPCTSTQTENCSVYTDSSKQCIQLPRIADASGTIASQQDTGAKVANCGPNSTPFLLGLVASGIAVVPLLAVWSVLKGALSAAGAIGGMVQNVSKPAIGWASKRRKEDMEALGDRRTLAAMNHPMGFSDVATFGAKRRKAFKDYARSSTKQELGYVTQQEAALKAKDSDAYARKLAGGSALPVSMGGATSEGVERALRRAQFTIDKAEIEEVNATEATIDRIGVTGEQLSELAQGESVKLADGNTLDAKTNKNIQKAALQKLAKQSDVGNLEKALAKIPAGDKDMGNFAARAVEQNWSGIKSKAAHITTGAVTDSLKTGKAVDLDAGMKEAMGGMDANLMSTQKTGTLNRLNKVLAATAAVNPQDKNVMNARAAANALRSNVQIYDKVNEASKDFVDKIAGPRTQATPTPVAGTPNTTTGPSNPTSGTSGPSTGGPNPTP